MEQTLRSDSFSATNVSTSSTSLVLRALTTLSVWHRRIVSRNELARLDARMLADAGITEAQRYEELQKPFWR
ncbi:DUF1127 domain-containing protein [Pseudomonas asuensis]|jgi:uncharacterized protein YjiS (DUF1127 family)|uniref:YjiS-like domain-containing protein n=1 Tax=Pseudomonas asuensis TaxID=1825787 RepID=A0ABQ2GRG4_9PSED|nr:DUF1127 domain-containing protein [Pseudomonas asuensis]GGM08492.1 hypothetical protein GCM10009425_19670 [Pseudomonas asuensis]